MEPQSQPILIKRYARSRLYDPTTGRYVTLEELRRWRARNVPFTVVDSETAEDISHVLLA
jgi:polyhydroxyalkanoate synthesis regulator protein